MESPKKATVSPECTKGAPAKEDALQEKATALAKAANRRNEEGLFLMGKIDV
jgi:hypothetical protein